MIEKIQKIDNIEEAIRYGVNIVRCIDITWINNSTHGQEPRNSFEAVDIHDQYIIWNEKVRSMLSKMQIPVSKRFEFESFGEVPGFKSGYAYGFSNSPQSIKLLSQISNEVNKKLQLLRVFTSESTYVSSEFLVYKEIDGTFYFNNSPITFPNTSALYYILFDCLFTIIPQGGTTTYEKMLKVLADNNYTDAHKIVKKSIQRALTFHNQGLFRYAKIKSKPLNNTDLKGKKLIQTIWGRGLAFNNRRIE